MKHIWSCIDVILTINLFSLNLLAVDTDGSDSSLIAQSLNDRAVTAVELTLREFMFL